MRWLGRRASDNVDDRRGGGMGGKIALGGIGTLIVAVLTLVMGGNPSDVINVISQQQTEQPVDTAAQSEQAQFVKVVLGDTEDVWNKVFEEKLNRKYQEPTLVLFSGSVESGCGSASASTGPFYCPLDQKVYIDLTFYDELKQRFNAPGDFAMAYVVAHEVGHHVQKLLGTSDKVRQLQSGRSQKEVNELSVKLELQADFYAGVWAHYDDKMKDVLEPGDIEEALNAANAIGDDRLQKEANGRVVPDAFTHGTSEQRMYWFKKGYETGDIAQGDTFSSKE